MKRGGGNPTTHWPELILKNFRTRLGRKIGRMFAAIFPQRPHLEGRQVVTLHNQRDYIFFRQHRYMFKCRARNFLSLLKRNLTKLTFTNRY